MPPHERKTLTKTRSNAWDKEDDWYRRGPLLSTTVIYQIYMDFQATSHSDEKLNIVEFNGEHNGDIFVDWL